MHWQAAAFRATCCANVVLPMLTRPESEWLLAAIDCNRKNDHQHRFAAA